MRNIENSLASTKFNRYAVLDVQVRDVSTILKSLRDNQVNNFRFTNIAIRQRILIFLVFPPFSNYSLYISMEELVY
jgi:hypothetical protein